MKQGAMIFKSQPLVSLYECLINQRIKQFAHRNQK